MGDPGATRFIIINIHLSHFIIIFIFKKNTFIFFEKPTKGFLGFHHYNIFITLFIFIKVIISNYDIITIPFLWKIIILRYFQVLFPPYSLLGSKKIWRDFGFDVYRLSFGCLERFHHHFHFRINHHFKE